MRVTRINKRPNNIKNDTKQPKEKRRRIVRAIKESDIPSITDVTNPLNEQGKFTYIDYNRNKGAIEMFRHQITQAIFNYGADLQYFRKFNTFFKDDETEENTSNYIYGEDTTAEFYASGMIRAYVSVENMAWNFNQIGLEATEQVNIFISIDNFEQAFQDVIAKDTTRKFEVPVYGDTITNEVTGLIVAPEFEAKVYAQFSDIDMTVKTAQITRVEKEVNRGFYKTLKYQSNDSEISGDLKGKLLFDDEKPFDVSGVLKGNLTFKGSKNKEDSETWQRLAPQVGDYFRFSVETGINEEWEISQVYDRNLTKSGLNPLLGKYVYQVSAVRRVASYEKNAPELDAKNPGEDIEEIFGNISKDSNDDILADQYQVKKGKNKLNKKTNKIAKNSYDYKDKDDIEYGGYQNKPKAK